MMKQLPSEVAWRGWLPRGPRKFLNRSFSGESGGRSGMAFLDGAFSVWKEEMFTTEGSSLAVRSAKLSGAGRAAAAVTAKPSPRMAKTVERARMDRPDGRIRWHFNDPAALSTLQSTSSGFHPWFRVPPPLYG